MKLLKNTVFRALRGGGCYDPSRSLRVIVRVGYGPEDRVGDIGFRFVVRTRAT